MWSHELQWLELLLRLMHVIIGAMWIGASFYIISWENKFNRSKDLREHVEGNFWTIQGGDFYYIEKLKAAPPAVPDELHWFKYEAYFTWLSGFLLMSLVFYFNADAMLVDPGVAKLSGSQGVVIGLGSLVVCWALYNLYCRTPLAKNYPLSAVVGLLFLAGLGYFFFNVFSHRAALIHVGAVLGTIMSANVFFVIIPWHKSLIRAIENGDSLNDLYARRPGFRSRHNHYMTVPVFLIMLGGHFPLFFNHPYNWIILAAVALAAGLIKHYHNQLQKKAGGKAYLLAGVVVVVGVVYASARDSTPGDYCAESVAESQVVTLVTTHCSACHSARPSDSTWTVAPAGVMFDHYEQMLAMKERIAVRVVERQDMPLANLTNMRPHERWQLDCWSGQAD
jgi:uncharacterized membrane protein